MKKAVEENKVIREKETFVNKSQLEKIANEYATPFHIYDEKGIRENAREFIEAFKWNPGFKEYFAVKATPNPAILKILKEEGFGVDCASYTELLMAKKCGFKGDEIMFTSNVTPEADFKLARELGATITLDDISHIDFLERLAGIPKTISCRYNPGGDFVLNNAIMDTPNEAKYGFTREQMTEGFLALKKKGAENFGIHSFLASNTRANEYYPKLARILFQTAVELKNETGVNIAFINLSGGVGIPYHPEDVAADIKIIGQGVKKAYEDILLANGMGHVAIYSELGRFVLGPYGALVARVLHKKSIHKEYVGLDACAVNLMRPAMYGAYHHITVMGKEGEPLDHTYDVTGGLCENNDKFAKDRKLPKIEVGDLVYIHDTGAHGFAMGYNYNGKLRSKEILLREDGSVELIRREEIPEDYFATLNF